MKTEVRKRVSNTFEELPNVEGGVHAPARRPVLVDAHVHFYPVFDEALFFRSAVRNFRHRANELGLPSETIGWLLMAETSKDHAFAAFAARAGAPAQDGWNFRKTKEEQSLLICQGEQEVLGLIAGRQIVTREGLEVLALGTVDTFRDGDTVAETIESVRAANALPVLPWGFGKWSFRRGALVSAYIDSGLERTLFWGDNGGRLALGPRPRLLVEAERRGGVILPGSDPLPFSGQEKRAGSFGFVLEGGVDVTRPAASLMTSLRELPASPPAFGRANGLVSFVQCQLRMALRKRGISW